MTLAERPGQTIFATDWKSLSAFILTMQIAAVCYFVPQVTFAAQPQKLTSAQSPKPTATQSQKSVTAAAKPQSNLQSGITKFNAGQFGGALEDFWRANSDDPHSPEVQYYIGSSLVKLNKAQDAVFHFEKAQQLAPKGSKVQEMATASIAALGNQSILDPSHQRSAGRHNRNSTNAGPATSLTFRHNQPYSYTPQPGNGTQPGPAGQSGFGSQTGYDPWAGYPAQGAGQNSGQYPDRFAARAARRAQHDADRRMRHHGHGPGSQYQSNYDPGRNGQPQGGFGPNMRASSWNDSASNLQSQLQDPKLTGSGVRLVPQGTGLNVRNYETFHSDDDDRANIIPLIAKPQRLQDMNPVKKTN